MILLILRNALSVWSLSVITTALIILSISFTPLWGLTVPIALLLILDIWEFVNVTMPMLRERHAYRPKHAES